MDMILGKHRPNRPRFLHFSIGTLLASLLNVSDISRYVVASVGFGETGTVCAHALVHCALVIGTCITILVRYVN